MRVRYGFIAAQDGPRLLDPTVGQLPDRDDGHARDRVSTFFVDNRRADWILAVVQRPRNENPTEKHHHGDKNNRDCLEGSRRQRSVTFHNPASSRIIVR